MAKKCKISAQKLTEVIADFIFDGKKRNEIVEHCTSAYNISVGFVDKCIKPAKLISSERFKEAESATRAMIREGREEMVNRLGLSQEAILSEYKKLAFFDLRKVYDDKNALIDVKDFDDASAAAVSGIEVLEEFEGAGAERRHIGNTVKLKISDKKAALDSICKVLGYVAPSKVAATDPDGNEAVKQVIIINGKEIEF